MPPLESELALLDVGPAPSEARWGLQLLVCSCVRGLFVLRKTDTAETMPAEGRVVEGDPTKDTSESGEYTGTLSRTRGGSSGHESFGLVRLDG